jgi:hypothetical protein
MENWKLIARLLSLLVAMELARSDSAKPSSESEAEPVFYVIPHTRWEGAVFLTREDVQSAAQEPIV